MLPPYPTLLRLAWRQYLVRFDLVLYGHLFFSLPLIIIATYLKQWFPLQDTITEVADLWPNFWVQVGIDNVVSIVTCLVGIIVILGLQQVSQKQHMGFVNLLWQALPLYLPLVLLNCLEIVLILLGFSALVMPGIVIAILLTFATPALVWHRLSIWQAMRHSILLVRGQFFWVLLYVVMVQLLISAVILVITWGLPTNFYFNIFATWLSAVCATFSLVFVTAMMNTSEALAALIPAVETSKKE